MNSQNSNLTIGEEISSVGKFKIHVVKKEIPSKSKGEQIKYKIVSDRQNVQITVKK